MPIATALHASDNQDNHWVSINNLRVLVTERDGDWFAQGVDLDYAACGRSLDEVKRNFERGLAGTINLHLKRFNCLERLLKITPFHVLEELSPDHAFDFSLATWHDLNEDLRALPYGGIAYLPIHASATA
ncbi:hypothetical protein U5801_27015 [Lamprobacter modestohalophilus]|uniref:hypothetical protein n=1 Tax=Lamprobacter modestohalophilus TaxID=1064514 RepID=UPI002ADEAF39|nr:hypothetical protein [Lamprobacter modestohalophilus]MEA1053427.1 hypothetical protein [Lamprobacter modestohalophilus]